MAQQIEQEPLQVKHGVLEGKAVMEFSRPINNLIMTPAQAIQTARAIISTVEVINPKMVAGIIWPKL